MSPLIELDLEGNDINSTGGHSVAYVYIMMSNCQFLYQFSILLCICQRLSSDEAMSTLSKL